jgi:cytochrome b561
MLRNTSRSWGLVSVLFHWIMAALFLSQFWLGWYMEGLSYLTQAGRKYELYQLHKSIGFTILALAVLRLLWALTSTRPKLPDTMPASEKKLALGTHVVLYFAFFLLPLTGWIVVSVSPLPIATWYFGLFVIPSLPVGISRSAEQGWITVHGFLAYASIFLAAVHILAALRHHFHHRDATLIRMLRPGHEGRQEDASKPN